MADSCTREPNEIGIDVELMLYTERSDDSAANAGPPTAFAHDELVLDVVQMSLDIVGIFDPTPISDGASALISIHRRDWFSAGISAIGFLPYLGDLAKMGKLPKYAESLRRIIATAHKDSRFAEAIGPSLRRLKSVLDDLPTGQLPERAVEAIGKMRRELDGLLGAAAKEMKPVTEALEKLPGKLREGFEKALQLEPLKNPRQLRKHPGPIAEDRLIEELESKGFVKIKEGSHPKADALANPKAREESDIWLRRIRDGEQDTFEAIRVDRTQAPTPSPGSTASASSSVGAKEKPFRRAHHTLSETTSDVSQPGANIETNLKDMVEQLGQGAPKGSFSHWHHEAFDATPENLAQYLKGPLEGTRKFDPVGQVLDTRRLTKGGQLPAAEVEKLKAKLGGE